MRLFSRIAIRLAATLIVLMSLWAVLFYFAMADQIHDEVDDALEDYTTLIITRKLAGRELPHAGDGSNNTFTITPVSADYARRNSHYRYHDESVYIPEKREYEPARVITTIFNDAEGQYYELKVSTPSFEKADLFSAVLLWIVALYVLLLLITVGITMLIFYRNMRPLYILLEWLDSYHPGVNPKPINNPTRVTEFKRLNVALQSAIDRSEQMLERQTQFIGNASHELQTPLAIIGNRVEWLLDESKLTDEQAMELYKINKTLSRAVRLNKTLLLLTKIENSQFIETSQVDLVAIVSETVESLSEIYLSRQIKFATDLSSKFEVQMNESLASTLVTNLIKNVYVHSEQGVEARAAIVGRKLIVENQGREMLDREHIFERFYQGSQRETSMGLGLALVAAICRHYNINIEYSFVNGSHRFEVDFVE
ncbi:MAG: HAMP domain-containing histidine kinase [Alistipes sp.]|nr:HAMP domain-containing histidine kinase [Alistipes sp.]